MKDDDIVWTMMWIIEISIKSFMIMRLSYPKLSYFPTTKLVIHSFASPSLAIKCDAYPGRLNQISVLINREGTFYGQCSEICGILHSSMPIVIQSVSIEKFLTWLDDQTALCLLLSSARFSRGSLSKNRVYTTVNLTPGLPLKKSEKAHIKWNNTKNIIDASKALKTMYDSLLDSDPLKLYIKNNCMHLLSLSGTTGLIPHDKLITTGYDNYLINSNEKIGHPSLYDGKSGIYVFECMNTGFQYIGSAICLNTRFKAHMVNSVRPERGGNNTLYLSAREFGWQRFTWKPVLITTNHMIKVLQQNPGLELGLNSLYILRSFTQFEARIYEQALLTHYSPRLNSGLIVTFSFGNFQKGDEIQIDSSIPLRVEGSNREFSMVYSSKNRAAISLGIPKTTLDRYVNLQNHSVYSPVLDMNIFLIDPSKPLSQDLPKYYKAELSPITDVDLYAFEKGKLFALCLDKKTVYGVYDSPTDAALSLDGKSESKYILRYINTERPVLVGSDQEPVFFVMNPEWKIDVKGRIAARPLSRKRSSRSKSIVLVDVKNNSALLFETVGDMLAFLGQKSITDTGFVKSYMNPTKLYKKQYEFHYESDFTGTITGKGPRRD